MGIKTLILKGFKICNNFLWLKLISGKILLPEKEKVTLKSYSDITNK